MGNKSLRVLCQGRLVGRVAETPERVLAFEYDAAWLRDGFSISPFKLPLEKRVFIASRDPFGGNFGVFDDSLPDGWGRLLIDRLLTKKGIRPAEVSVLDRLAIVGRSGKGALEYAPEDVLVTDASIPDLDTLAREAEAILNEKDDGCGLEELVRLGGSSGGARPKVLLNVDGEAWIIKFRASIDPSTIGQQEFDAMRTAEAAGLDVPEVRLFEGKYFGARRFDRTGHGGKVFMISASGLLNASHRFPCLDYNALMAATLALTRDYREVEKMFRLMCFNVFWHNRDDHAKNFSFLYDDGRWRLSPSYDLTYSDGMGGEHATSIDGEGRNPSEANIMGVAKKCGMTLTRAEKIMDDVKVAVKHSKSRKHK